MGGEPINNERGWGKAGIVDVTKDQHASDTFFLNAAQDPSAILQDSTKLPACKPSITQQSCRWAFRQWSMKTFGIIKDQWFATIHMDRYNQSRVPEVYGATISLILLATIAVAARLVARKLSTAKIWWDNSIIVVALVSFNNLQDCKQCLITLWTPGCELGPECGILVKHQAWGIWSPHCPTWWTCRPNGNCRLLQGIVITFSIHCQRSLTWGQLFLVVQVIYLTSAALVKTSLILLYYRIFGVINWFRWLLATAWALVIANSVVCIIVAVFKCRPVGLFRDESIDDGSCIDRIQFYRWNGVANLVLDFAIWTLPLPVTFQLQMNIRQKLSVSAVFLLGLL